MTRVVDLSVFEKLSAECLRVHHAVANAGALCSNAEALIARAEEVVRATGLAYLTEGRNLEDEPRETRAGTPADQVVEGYLDVQRSVAALVAALYEYAASCIEAKAWPELVDILLGLQTFDGESNRWSALRTTAQDASLIGAEELVDAEAWSLARKVLSPWLDSAEARFLYGDSYARQAESTGDPGPLLSLVELTPFQSEKVELIRRDDPEDDFNYLEGPALVPLRDVAESAAAHGTLRNWTAKAAFYGRYTSTSDYVTTHKTDGELDWPSVHACIRDAARDSYDWRNVRPSPRVPQ